MAMDFKWARRAFPRLFVLALMLLTGCGEHKSEEEAGATASGTAGAGTGNVVDYGDFGTGGGTGSTTGSSGTGTGTTGLSASDANTLDNAFGDELDIDGLLSFLGGTGNFGSASAAQKGVGDAMKVLGQLAGDGRFSSTIIPVLQAIAEELKKIKPTSGRSFWMSILKTIRGLIIKLLKKIIGMLLRFAESAPPVYFPRSGFPPEPSPLRRASAIPAGSHAG